MGTRWYNERENRVYYEGRSMTQRTDKGLFSGVPSEEQLKAWGFEPQPETIPTPPSEEEIAYNERQARMEFLHSELARTDFIPIKAFEGLDVSKYGDWKGMRNAWREEYNRLEAMQEESTN